MKGTITWSVTIETEVPDLNPDGDGLADVSLVGLSLIQDLFQDLPSPVRVKQIDFLYMEGEE